jgi:hypothetical protein
MILEVEPLLEIHTKDISACPLPDGGLCNGGLMRLKDGWLVVATNKSTPRRRLIGKYSSYPISIILNEDFTMRCHSLTAVECVGFTGWLHDIRISELFQISGCYRRSLGHSFQPFFGRFKKEDGGAIVMPVLNEKRNDDKRLMRYDVKNWVHLSDSVLDCGPMPLFGMDHGAMVYSGGDCSALEKIPTPLFGGHPARPSAPAFHWRDHCIATYHHHQTHARTGERMYFHQFAKLRDDVMDITVSTPPLRFSYRQGDGIQFLTGALPDGDSVILSYGVNDESNVIARASMIDILNLMH